MCYAIPGKVIAVSGNIATIDYFGELRRAHVMDYIVQIGDYVYTQGGIVVERISAADAIPILEIWREQFFELKNVDARLSSTSIKGNNAIASLIAKVESGETLNKNDMLMILSTENRTDLEMIYTAANRTRRERLDNACCVHGIIEFSNHCLNDCVYCGIRCSNKTLKRYRMSSEEIIDAVDYAVRLGFRSLVLQSGEDQYYTDNSLAAIVKEIHEKHGVLLFVSIGERSKECYRQLYKSGAYGALIRFESSNRNIYEKMRPGKKLSARVNLIRWLKETGFILATGFLIGFPGQTKDDIINDIMLAKSLKSDMYSFGPLIPHPQTPIATIEKPSLNDILKVISLSRLVDPDAKILATTALETLGPDAGVAGLLAGANSLMINTTPSRYRKLYDLYPGKTGTGESVEAMARKAVELLRSLGRAPTDLGV